MRGLGESEGAIKAVSDREDTSVVLDELIKQDGAGGSRQMALNTQHAVSDCALVQSSNLGGVDDRGFL